MYINNRRQFFRVPFIASIKIIIGSQLVVKGKIRDLSVKSAFIDLNNSIYLAPNDEMTFEIPVKKDKEDLLISGTARVSRVAKGEGIAIFFTDMDKASIQLLEDLVGKPEPEDILEKE